VRHLTFHIAVKLQLSIKWSKTATPRQAHFACHAHADLPSTCGNVNIPCHVSRSRQSCGQYAICSAQNLPPAHKHVFTLSNDRALEQGVIKPWSRACRIHHRSVANTVVLWMRVLISPCHWQPLKVVRLRTLATRVSLSLLTCA